MNTGDGLEREDKTRREGGEGRRGEGACREVWSVGRVDVWVEEKRGIRRTWDPIGSKLGISVVGVVWITVALLAREL